jgi:hypothetical protein
MSPNEYILIKLEEKKDHRIIEIGKTSTGMGANAKSYGIDPKTKVQFDVMPVSEGIFKITFKEVLKSGEYGFLYANGTGKVFDFGIPKEQNLNQPTYYGPPNPFYHSSKPAGKDKQ